MCLRMYHTPDRTISIFILLKYSTANTHHCAYLTINPSMLGTSGGIIAMIMLVGLQVVGGLVSALFRPLINGLLQKFTVPIDIVCPKVGKAVVYYINNKRNTMEVTTDKYRDDDTIIRQNLQKYASGMCSYRGHPFYVSNPNTEGRDAAASASDDSVHIIIYFCKIGYSYTFLKEFLDHCRSDYDRYMRCTIKDKIDCYEWTSEGYRWQFIDNIPCRPHDSVAGDLHRRILSSVKRYLDQRDNYLDLHIPRKRTILLHGPPGTGKTLLAYLIASVNRMPLFKISLKDTKLTNDILKNASRVITPGACVLWDEFRYDVIEAIGAGHSDQRIVRTDTGGLRVESCTGVDAACVLSEFDGGPASNRINIIITNYYKDLVAVMGPTFMRDGRIDEVYEVGFSTRDDVIDYYQTTIKTLLKTDGGAAAVTLPPSTVRRWCTAPGAPTDAPDLHRITVAANCDDPARSLEDRLLNNPFTVHTMLYDLLIYLRTVKPSMNRHLCRLIREEIGIDLLPACAIPTRQLPCKIRDLCAIVKIHRIIDVLSREFADRVMAVSDTITMAKLQTVLIRSHYSFVLMLDNHHIVTERDRVTDIEVVSGLEPGPMSGPANHDDVQTHHQQRTMHSGADIRTM